MGFVGPFSHCLTVHCIMSSKEQDYIFGFLSLKGMPKKDNNSLVVLHMLFTHCTYKHGNG